MERRVLDEFARIVGARGLISEIEQLRTYDCDGLTSYHVTPAAVVLPTTTTEVQSVVRLCARERIPFVARGSGTGLSGGALPVADGIVISLTRMNRVLSVDALNGRIVVQPGVLNLNVSNVVAPYGLFYAPDPSSQQICSIGGNVAENSGGAHCLKYGFTVNHVLGLTVVLPDGEIVELGGLAPGQPGYDLIGVFVGSEGTLGIATEITLRLVRKPEAVQMVLGAFNSTDDAGEAVSAIIASGILPSAIEMMDRLSLKAAEEAVHAGYPEAGALLLVELDGPSVEVEAGIAQIESLCRAYGALETRLARSAEERALMWKGRKAAFAAMGRISPGYLIQDGVVPRTSLPQVLRRVDALSSEYGLAVANVFHAGDGNLHPLVLYDPAIPGQAEHAEELATEILLACVELGGSLSGEHGIGYDKKKHMPKMFSDADLEMMHWLRCAWDPAGIANPGKVFPTPRLCGERPGPYRPHPKARAGVAEIF